MNPYTSIWSGVADGDGPREFHLVLLDAGRTDVLADEVGRAALRCIRCSACLNVCPVYERTGGHAYESVYPGPIGAILTPQLQGLENAPTLPWASSLCGACYEVCPVKIDIPSILVHLRGRVVREVGAPGARARGDGRDGARVRQPPRLRGRAARRQARARAAGRRGAAAVDALARAARGARADASGTGGVSTAREDVLGRVRAALRDVPAGEALARRSPTSPPPPPAGDPVARFAERVADYRATVREADDVAATIAPRVRRARRAPARRAGRAARGVAARRRSSSSRTTA